MSVPLRVPTTLTTDRAQQAFDDLMLHYWDEPTGLFKIRVPVVHAEHDLPSDPFHYWWQAHALDSLIDAFRRDGNALHLQRAARLLGSIQMQNASLTNDYYDDMEWLALAALRAWDASQNPVFKHAALTLWADIQGGWNEHCGGGIAWRKPQLDYKNTPANAPAVILAARLYTRFGDASDLAWAQRIFGWLEAHLINPVSGFVWDGMNRLGDATTDRDWTFTYCQGVVVGAALELHHITEKPEYLAAAHRTAGAALTQLADPVTQVMPDEGGGDAGLFKGILVRYLAQLVQVTGNESIRRWLTTNANAAWTYRDAASGLSGRSWQALPQFPLELTAALSGVMLFEQMAALNPAPEDLRPDS
ncbi:glycosyl hydrolase [Deinococcus psychrotolerans]|uniref:Glycosyl hydrolase n=1 Tax=Deinococcus psychrotolerans TaxID=2489213 RepID=A0A3G8YGU5_9DEIO|nr:glycoside hydrolase family 76 protein [Deinococcus psychrotolerans]AZI44060.1 glycosyl hydrolase [Deinococcus psychrotolerans]